MSIAEILLMLAEIAAALSVVDSVENQMRRDAAALAWNSALHLGPRGSAQKVYDEQVNALHEWRKAEIEKAVTKVRAGFGIQSSRAIP